MANERVIRHQDMTEKQFQRRVTDTAKTYGWLFHHCRPAYDHGQFRTPIEGHRGFPDLVLVHPLRGVVIFAELKTDRGETTDQQDRWLGALALCHGVRTRTWRPKHWETVLAELSGKDAHG
jgi:hypothetical protein